MKNNLNSRHNNTIQSNEFSIIFYETANNLDKLQTLDPQQIADATVGQMTDDNIITKINDILQNKPIRQTMKKALENEKTIDSFQALYFNNTMNIELDQLSSNALNYGTITLDQAKQGHFPPDIEDSNTMMLTGDEGLKNFKENEKYNEYIGDITTYPLFNMTIYTNPKRGNQLISGFTKDAKMYVLSGWQIMKDVKVDDINCLKTQINPYECGGTLNNSSQSAIFQNNEIKDQQPQKSLTGTVTIDKNNNSCLWTSSVFDDSDESHPFYIQFPQYSVKGVYKSQGEGNDFTARCDLEDGSTIIYISNSTDGTKGKLYEYPKIFFKNYSIGFNQAAMTNILNTIN